MCITRQNRNLTVTWMTWTLGMLCMCLGGTSCKQSPAGSSGTSVVGPPSRQQPVLHPLSSVGESRGKSPQTASSGSKKGRPRHSILSKPHTVFGVFIGINQSHPEMGLRSLRYAARDACEVYKTFVKYGRLQPQNARVMLDGIKHCGKAKVEAPSLTRAREMIGDWLPKAATPSDRVIIFYSGHGLQPIPLLRNGPWELYFLFPKSRRDRLHSTALGHRELKQILQGLRSREQILFLDACHSAWIMPKALVSPSPVMELRGSRRFICASSIGNEESIEYLPKQAGLFTHSLLQALRGQADITNDNIIDHLEVERYLMTWVPRYAEQLFKPPRKQNPVCWGAGTGILPITWIPSSSQE